MAAGPQPLMALERRASVAAEVHLGSGALHLRPPITGSHVELYGTPLSIEPEHVFRLAIAVKEKIRRKFEHCKYDVKSDMAVAPASWTSDLHPCARVARVPFT